MSGSDDGTLLRQNLRRETWCRVEAEPRQAWLRSQRRHYQAHLKSSPVLLAALTDQSQRSTARGERLPPTQLPQRRHFEESYKSHLV